MHHQCYCLVTKCIGESIFNFRLWTFLSFFLRILSMGTTDSKLAFRKGVFRLFEERVSNNTSWL